LPRDADIDTWPPRKSRIDTAALAAVEKKVRKELEALLPEPGAAEAVMGEIALYQLGRVADAVPPSEIAETLDEIKKALTTALIALLEAPDGIVEMIADEARKKTADASNDGPMPAYREALANLCAAASDAAMRFKIDNERGGRPRHFAEDWLVSQLQVICNSFRSAPGTLAKVLELALNAAGAPDDAVDRLLDAQRKRSNRAAAKAPAERRRTNRTK